MSPKPQNLDDFGRFSEPAVLILISLAGQPRHGYAICDDIERVVGHRPGPGTLYGAIARLESRGFITPMRAEGNRSIYKLTAAGSEALEARLRAMEHVTRLGRERLTTT